MTARQACDVPGTVKQFWENQTFALLKNGDPATALAQNSSHHGLWAGLLQAAHGPAMPPQPQGASLHGWISAVWFGSVGGDEFDFGWGPTPRPPILCIFMYL